jgi:hypothetical protein
MLAEESMVCCRGSRLEMIPSHPTAIAVSVAVEGDRSIPTLPMESMLSATRNDLFPSNYDRHEQLT